MDIKPTITGIGLVTPLGRTAQDTFDALLAGRHITSHARVEAKSQTHLPRVVSLAIEAADEAIAQAGWNDNRSDIAIVACTSKGSIESWIDAASGIVQPMHTGSVGNAKNHLSTSINFGLSDLSAQLADHIGSIGPRLCLSAACASGLHGLIRATMMIQSGEAKRVLVTAAEASVNPLFLASFERLGVLPAAGELCRPFDRNRSGFLMSEAAAAICLEGDADSSRMLVSIARFAFGGDATHLTGSDPDTKVLRHLLHSVIDDEPIDFIHAHGTGTVTNDSIELTAFESLGRPARLRSFDACIAVDSRSIKEATQASQPQKSDQLTPIFSHKAALGHSLGASGLVATALNCLIHQTQKVPGNVNTLKPLPSTKFEISRHVVTRPIQRSIVHAAGFGGPTSIVSFRSNSSG